MSKLTANQQKWVDALRSGEFEQGKKTLRSGENQWCCLGVACAVASRNGVDVDLSQAYHESGLCGTYFKGVSDWLGMDGGPLGGLGDYKEGTENNCLAWDNDHNGKSFSEIADIIEAHADELFVSPAAEERT